jgi:hypothetical protein
MRTNHQVIAEIFPWDTTPCFLDGVLRTEGKTLQLGERAWECQWEKNEHDSNLEDFAF